MAEYLQQPYSPQPGECQISERDMEQYREEIIYVDKDVALLKPPYDSMTMQCAF